MTKISLDKEDFIDIKNLYTNTLSGNIQNRGNLRELLDTEEDFIDKITYIQNERDSLLIEKIELLKTIKKLEVNYK